MLQVQMTNSEDPNRRTHSVAVICISTGVFLYKYFDHTYGTYKQINHSKLSNVTIYVLYFYDQTKRCKPRPKEVLVLL